VKFLRNLEVLSIIGIAAFVIGAAAFVALLVFKPA
jgi:hypothetical protein